MPASILHENQCELYSGGPTETDTRSRIEAMSSEDTLTDQVSEGDQHSSSEDTSWVPVGQAYPLNSKRVKVAQLHGIAMALLLPASGTAAVTRQLIEVELLEMEREPRNAQVVVQDSGEDSVISLIDESGIICTYNSREHVPHEHGLHAGQPADETLTREEPSGVRSALHDTGDDLVEVKRALEAKSQELQAALERLREVEEALDAERRNYEQKDVELTEARSSLEREKRKVKRVWREKCDLQLSHEDEMDEKDLEIMRLKACLLSITSPSAHTRPPSSGPDHATSEPDAPSPHRRGKASPVDIFSMEVRDEQWDKWFPTFKRTAEWNGWNEEECLLQLAGYLRGKARQEILLLTPEEKSTFAKTKIAMKNRLQVGSKTLAAQDFRHATQGSQESAADYILRLEKAFRRAYGSDPMGEETRNALLYAQLQEGLKYVLMKAPAVSGTQEYKELCVAAKNEERWLVELRHDISLYMALKLLLY